MKKSKSVECIQCLGEAEGEIINTPARKDLGLILQVFTLAKQRREGLSTL